MPSSFLMYRIYQQAVAANSSINSSVIGTAVSKACGANFGECACEVNGDMLLMTGSAEASGVSTAAASATSSSSSGSASASSAALPSAVQGSMQVALALTGVMVAAALGGATLL